MDPNTRRARNLSRLVILTIALPSLLLTALGAMAVANEEAAARRRLEELYRPFGIALAKRFNQWIDDTSAADGPHLEALARWAQAGSKAPLPQELVRFFEANDFRVNFFVVSEDGQTLLPRPPESLPTELVHAVDMATELAGPRDCSSAKNQLDRLGLDETARCTVHLAFAFCSDKESAWRRWDEVCPAWRKSPVIEKARLLRAHAKVPGVMEIEALALAQDLASPLSDHPPWLVHVVARAAADRLRGKAKEEQGARHVLASIALRDHLFRSLSSRNRVFMPYEANSAAVGVDGWRRVLVSRSVDGLLVGYELVPDLVAKQHEGLLEEQGLDASVRLAFHAISAPKWWYYGDKEKADPDEEDNVAWWVLLKKTDLAWTMGLLFNGEPDFWDLRRSRRHLYLWSLIMIVVALLAGIGHTIRALTKEARLSRLKTDFVSSVSHDLRTPLTSIRMYTETLLLNRVESKEEARDFLEVIALETERLSRLTERILDFSRMEAGRKAYSFEPQDIQQVVQHALRSCRPMIEQSEGHVDVEVPDDLPEVLGDHDALIEVLINLVTNAVKYSPNLPEITIRARAEDKEVVLEVEDEGIGIPVAEQGRIFEKFHRVDCPRALEVGGCGIGLSLVQHIVCAHGGSAAVRSAPGQGSVFTVRLPLAAPIGHPALGEV